MLPKFRRLGLNEALAARLSQLDQTELGTEYTAVHVDPNNSVIKEWSGIPPWKTRPFRAYLPCAALAGPPAGRPATPAVAAAAARWINALHEREALFLPYDATTLAERLARQPHSYGWSQLLLGESAVLVRPHKNQSMDENPGSSFRDGEPVGAVIRVLGAEGYERSRLQRHIARVHDVMLDALAGRADSPRSILDVGCGTGRLLRKLGAWPTSPCHAGLPDWSARARELQRPSLASSPRLASSSRNSVWCLPDSSS